MTAPFFSIVIPVFNRASKLGDAIRSVLAQGEQDFEIVVVDDGSSDDPEAVARAFRDPRILFMRQPNRGGGAARNAGIDLARGRFVAFLDSDDAYLPNHLANMRTALASSENTVGYARIVVDRGRGRMLIKPPRAIRPGEAMADYLLRDRGFVPTITVVVERRIAARVRYDEDLRAAEDTDFAIRLQLAGCRFAMVEEPGAVWRDLPDPNRTSAGRKGGRMVAWLEEMRPKISERAYYGCKGWAIAKFVAMTHPASAFRLWLTAVLRGCYRPSLAAVIFLQIFLPDRGYRRLADDAVRFLKPGSLPGA